MTLGGCTPFRSIFPPLLIDIKEMDFRLESFERSVSDSVFYLDMDAKRFWIVLGKIVEEGISD